MILNKKLKKSLIYLNNLYKGYEFAVTGSLSLKYHGLLNRKTIGDVDLVFHSKDREKFHKEFEDYITQENNLEYEEINTQMEICGLKIDLFFRKNLPYESTEISGVKVNILEPSLAIEAKLGYVRHYINERLGKGENLNKKQFKNLKKHLKDINYYNSKQEGCITILY